MTSGVASGPSLDSIMTTRVEINELSDQVSGSLDALKATSIQSLNTLSDSSKQLIELTRLNISKSEEHTAELIQQLSTLGTQFDALDSFITSDRAMSNLDLVNYSQEVDDMVNEMATSVKVLSRKSVSTGLNNSAAESVESTSNSILDYADTLIPESVARDAKLTKIKSSGSMVVGSIIGFGLSSFRRVF